MSGRALLLSSSWLVPHPPSVLVQGAAYQFLCSSGTFASSQSPKLKICSNLKDAAATVPKKRLSMTINKHAKEINSSKHTNSTTYLLYRILSQVKVHQVLQWLRMFLSEIDYLISFKFRNLNIPHWDLHSTTKLHNGVQLMSPHYVVGQLP